MKLVMEGAGSGRTKADPALAKALVRGRQWFYDLVSGAAASTEDIATREGVTRRYVGRLIPLAFLAPEIVEAIAHGVQPIELTAEVTTRIDLALDWSEQKQMLGLV